MVGWMDGKVCLAEFQTFLETHVLSSMAWLVEDVETECIVSV